MNDLLGKVESLQIKSDLFKDVKCFISGEINDSVKITI